MKATRKSKTIRRQSMKPDNRRKNLWLLLYWWMFVAFVWILVVSLCGVASYMAIAFMEKKWVPVEVKQPWLVIGLVLFLVPSYLIQRYAGRRYREHK